MTQAASSSVAPGQLADLLWSTDPKLNGYMFGSIPVLHKVIGHEWPDDHGLLCHRQAFTASRGDSVAGLLIGHTDDEYESNFEHSTRHQPEALEPDEAAHLRAALFLMDRLFPVPRPQSYYVLEFAVLPQAQGEGVAMGLLEAAEARARERRCARLCLDVAADNAAVGFYRHVGFRVDVETRIPALDAAHGIGLHLHMEREIV